MKVRKKCCATCIYKPASPLDLEGLERKCQDRFGHFFTYRACHKNWPEDDVCCSCFFHTHGKECTPVQIAERLSAIEYVE